MSGLLFRPVTFSMFRALRSASRSEDFLARLSRPQQYSLSRFLSTLFRRSEARRAPPGRAWCLLFRSSLLLPSEQLVSLLDQIWLPLLRRRGADCDLS